MLLPFRILIRQMQMVMIQVNVQDMEVNLQYLRFVIILMLIYNLIYPIYTIDQSQKLNNLPMVCQRFSQNISNECFLHFFLDFCQNQSNTDAQSLADTLQILSILIPHVHETILDNVNFCLLSFEIDFIQLFDFQYLKLLPNLSRCLSSKYTVIRYLTSRCFGILSLHKTDEVLQFIINSIIPKLSNTNMDVSYLQGPIETLYRKICHVMKFF